MMEQNVHEYFTYLHAATIAKREGTETEAQRLRAMLEGKNAYLLNEEYWNLEQVPPSPGRPDMAHDKMVEKGKLM